MVPQERNSLSFHLKGTCADGTQLSLASMEPALLKRYLDCWCKLTEKDKTARISLQEGSLVANLTMVNSIWSALVADISHISQGNYSAVSPANRDALIKMTTLAQRDNLQLSVCTPQGEIYNTSTATAYVHADKVEVDEETEIEGLVTDAGGKSCPNIHIVGKSRVYIVSATQKQLSLLSTNILYKHICMRVSYKYNVLTDECCNYKLKEIVDTTPISKEAMKQLVDRESMLWKDVKNPLEWLHAYRGESES